MNPYTHMLNPEIIQIPRGLGDAFYCYPIIRHLLQSKFVGLVTCYPDLFKNLYGNKGHYIYTNYERFKDAKTLKYTDRRSFKTTIFEDLLISAGIKERIPFKIIWQKTFTDIFLRARAFKIIAQAIEANKNICIVKKPAQAHMHKHREAYKNKLSVSPNVSEMQKEIWNRKDTTFFIGVGQNETYVEKLVGLDLDLSDQLDLSDYITLVKISDLVMTQVGHLIPIAQAFSKKLLIFYPKDPQFFYLRPEKIGQIYSKEKL